MDNDSVGGPAPQAPRTYAPEPLRFTGSGGEYFGIWIVNLLLTILTIGIYSAWGKVRKKGYLYAHTRLAGDGFEFRASPLAVLKGRCMAVPLVAFLLVIGLGPGAEVPALIDP